MKQNAVTHNQRVRLILSVLVVIIALLWILPFGIRYGIKKFFLAAGAEQVTVDDVDCNPFTGKLVIHDLSVRKNGQTPLQLSKLMLNLSWIDLVRKRIFIESLLIDSTELSVNQKENGNWEVAGIALPEVNDSGEEAHFEWGLGTGKAELTESKVHFNGAGLDFQLNIRHLAGENIKSWEPDRPSTFDVRGQLNDAPVYLQAEMKPFAESEEVKGKITLEHLSLPPFAIAFIAVDGIVVDRGFASSRGTFYYGKKNGEIYYGFDGNTEIQDLQVTSPEKKIGLLGLKKLSFEDLVIAGTENIKIARIEAEAVNIARPLKQQQPGSSVEEPVMKTDKLIATDLVLTGMNHVFIQSADMHRCDFVLHRAADGSWPTIYATLNALIGPDPDDTPDKQESASADIVIHEMRISESCTVSFLDETVHPVYKTTAVIDKAVIQNIDSANADSKSPVRFEGKVGEYAAYKFKGDITPFADRLSMTLAGKITELDLHPLSSYTAHALGYNVSSGHLNAEVDLQVQSGEIKAENELELKKLKLLPKDAGRIKQLASDLTISLESALSLLRDKDGTIRLKLPVSGDISDPKFGLQDIISKALIAGTKKAVFSYLKHVFQPYGTLISVMQLAGKAARIRLDPVPFTPGSHELDESAIKYLNVVAKLMLDRPHINLSVCGKASMPDQEAIKNMSKNASDNDAPPPQQDKEKKTEESGEEMSALYHQQLLDLAKERSVVINDYLIKQSGIEAGRLFICNPEIDIKEKSVSRAELLI